MRGHRRLAIGAVGALGLASMAHTGASAYFQGSFVVCGTLGSVPPVGACVTSVQDPAPPASGMRRVSTVTIASQSVPGTYLVGPTRNTPGDGSLSFTLSGTGFAVSSDYRVNVLDPLEYESAVAFGVTGAPLSNLDPTLLSLGGSHSVPYLDQKCLEKSADSPDPLSTNPPGGHRGFALATGTTDSTGALASSTSTLTVSGRGLMGSGPAIVCVAILDSTGHVVGGNSASVNIPSA